MTLLDIQVFPKFTPLNLSSGSYWKLYCTKMKELAKKEKGREFRNQDPHLEGYPPVNGVGKSEMRSCAPGAEDSPIRWTQRKSRWELQERVHRKMK